MRVAEQILNLARWAPSGDNEQPWRFEIVSDKHIAIHGFDTRDRCLYDFDGHASHMAHGALLETLRIAATGFALDAVWSLRRTSDRRPVYDVRLEPSAIAKIDPLFDWIEKRTVQRRAMRMTRLTDSQRAALRSAVGPLYDVSFFEDFSERRRIARMLWHSGYIRLTCPEAYQVHKNIIEWNARFSKDRIPEEAVGVDRFTAKLMRWVLRDWKRVQFFNTYLFGTVAPRLQLDCVPALRCAAHAAIKPQSSPRTIEDYVRAGIAMQRFWLTATASGLSLQPEMTPLIFRWYVRAGRRFSASASIVNEAAALAVHFEDAVRAQSDTSIVFFCRLGRSPAPVSRSLRKEVGELLLGAERLP